MPKDSPSVQEVLIEWDQVLHKLKLNLQKTQQTMKKYADKRHIPMEFKVGDQVLVKLQP